MYSPFNSKSRCEFIRKEFEQEYIAFPKVIDEAYSAVINWLFTLGDPDFDKNKAKLKDDDMDDDMSNTASQFSCYLPSHAIKAYQTLLRIDEPIGLLGKPQITFIDIGCGGGAASIGLISLVINYQTYRKANNLPVFPIEISCFGIDHNKYALQIYGRFINECASRVKPHLIDLHLTPIPPGTFPENSPQIINHFSKCKRTHLVIFTFSNVIRPLTRSREQKSRVLRVFERVGMGKLLPRGWGQDIGFEEIDAIRAIFKTCNVDVATVLLIGASSIESTELVLQREIM